MRTWRTAAATYSGIRNRWPVRRRAGRPDSPGHRFGPLPGRRLRSRSPESPKPMRASVTPAGHAAAVGRHFRLGVEILGVEIGVFRAGGLSPRSTCLALLVACETAI